MQAICFREVIKSPSAFLVHTFFADYGLNSPHASIVELSFDAQKMSLIITLSLAESEFEKETRCIKNFARFGREMT